MKKIILLISISMIVLMASAQSGQILKKDFNLIKGEPTFRLWGDRGVIDFNKGDITLTNSTNTLTLAGGVLALENGAIINNTDADTLELIETVVKVTGNLFITGSIANNHAGGMSYISTAGTQTIATGGTFEKLFEGDMAYSSGHLHDFTEADGRLTYTGTPSIHVTITATLSITSDEAAQVCEFRIAKGGTTIAATNMPITFTATTTAMNVTLKWLGEAATGEYYELFGTSDTNDDTFILNNAVFAITKH